MVLALRVRTLRFKVMKAPAECPEGKRCRAEPEQPLSNQGHSYLPPQNMAGERGLTPKLGRSLLSLHPSC